jgi:hypothetical protein
MAQLSAIKSKLNANAPAFVPKATTQTQPVASSASSASSASAAPAATFTSLSTAEADLKKQLQAWLTAGKPMNLNYHDGQVRYVTGGNGPFQPNTSITNTDFALLQTAWATYQQEVWKTTTAVLSQAQSGSGGPTVQDFIAEVQGQSVHRFIYHINVPGKASASSSSSSSSST